MSSDIARITVICTFFNDVDRVDDALSRIASMASRGAQVILVDDASTDGTADALRVHASQMPGIKVVARATNGGVAAARTEAMGHATREFVWFCDSDDTWEPTLADALLSGVRSDETDVVVGGAEIVEYRSRSERQVDVVPRETELSADEARHAILTGELHGYLWNKLFRIAMVRDLGFAPIRSQSDFVFTYRAVGLARRVSRIPAVVYSHQLRAGSVSQTSSDVADNLRYCYDTVAGDLTAHGSTESGVLDRFRLWFYVIPATRALLRSGMSREATVDSIRTVTSTISLVAISRSITASPTTAAQGLLIKLFPGLVARAYAFRRDRRRGASTVRR